MSEEKQTNPKVFISYSWAVQDRVKKLAERLIENGVDVIVDIYDLKNGQDKYLFMEQAVNNPEIQKVLIVCDKTYTQKANCRSGGVGDETVIISPEVYGTTNQTKFIPIIFEKDEHGNPFCPTYLRSRIYIDFSDVDLYEEKFEVLLRDIYQVPLNKKPKLGKKPEWLQDNNFVTSSPTPMDKAISRKEEIQQKIDKLSLQILKNDFAFFKANLLSSQQWNLYSNTVQFISFVQRTEMLIDYIQNLPEAKQNINLAVLGLLYLVGPNDSPFGTTDNEIIVNTYSYLASPAFTPLSISNFSSLSNRTNAPTDKVVAFKDRILRPFVNILESYLDNKCVDMGIEKANQFYTSGQDLSATCSESLPKTKHDSRTSRAHYNMQNNATSSEGSNSHESQIFITLNGGQVNIAQGNSMISANQNNNGINPEHMQKMIDNILSVAKEHHVSGNDLQRISESLGFIKDELQKPAPKKTTVRLILDGLLSTSSILGTIPTIAAKINDFAQYIAPLLN